METAFCGWDGRMAGNTERQARSPPRSRPAALRRSSDLPRTLSRLERNHNPTCRHDHTRGWNSNHTRPGKKPAPVQASFDAAADELLAAPGRPRAVLHRCTHYRGGTGEVLQFSNLGQSCDRHQARRAPMHSFPPPLPSSHQSLNRTPRFNHTTLQSTAHPFSC